MKPHFRITIETLLASGTSQREIARRTGVDRKTIRRYAAAYLASANSPGVATGFSGPAGQTPPPWPPGIPGMLGLDGSPAADPVLATMTTAWLATVPAVARSACAPHREWIEAQVQVGRNAMSIYQELVDAHGFRHRYNSVKRFVRA